MVIAIIYGTGTATAVKALTANPFKFHTTAQVYNMVPLLNHLPASGTTHSVDSLLGLNIVIGKYGPIRRYN